MYNPWHPYLMKKKEGKTVK